MTNRRNTIQKDLVRNAVYEMKRHVTANEVYDYIKEHIADWIEEAIEIRNKHPK